MTTVLTYSEVGATRPADSRWKQAPSGFRSYARTVEIGHGTDFWDRVSAEVIRWGVKRRSGFRVSPDTGAVEGADYRISAGFGPVLVHEPVRVVEVVDLPDRRGFAYGTCTDIRFPARRRSSSTATAMARSTSPCDR